LSEEKLIGIKSGEEVGDITVKLPFKAEIKIPLVVKEDIRPLAFWKRIEKSITLFFKQLYQELKR